MSFKRLLKGHRFAVLERLILVLVDLTTEQTCLLRSILLFGFFFCSTLHHFFHHGTARHFTVHDFLHQTSVFLTVDCIGTFLKEDLSEFSGFQLEGDNALVVIHDISVKAVCVLQKEVVVFDVRDDDVQKEEKDGRDEEA